MIKHTFMFPPVEQQRPKATRFGNSINVYDPAKVKQFKKTIAQEAMLTYRSDPLSGRIAVKVTFYRPNQKNVSKIEKERRESGMKAPVVKPDLDNYIKSFLDALHGIYWKDDALITDISAGKRYSQTPRIEIEVKEI